MISVLRKEINLFLSSLIGYIAIVVFLVITSLFLWIFPGPYNVFFYGFASLEGFFEFAPFIFLFLIPAITMRTFSEEKNSGTIEILATKPISDLGILLGKYFAAMLLVVFALLFTLVYVYTIASLAVPEGDIDTGAIIGSYIGLLFIGGCFVSLGIFASAITGNQIVAFVIGLFLCFFTFFAFDEISRFSDFSGSWDYLIRNLGISEHYRSISRGVFDLRDVIYFLSFITLFISASKTVLESRKW